MQVTRDSHIYVQDIEEREEGGTPAIIESIRAALCFQLKRVITKYTKTHGSKSNGGCAFKYALDSRNSIIVIITSSSSSSIIIIMVSSSNSCCSSSSSSSSSSK